MRKLITIFRGNHGRYAYLLFEMDGKNYLVPYCHYMKDDCKFDNTITRKNGKLVGRRGVHIPVVDLYADVYRETDVIVNGYQKKSYCLLSDGVYLLKYSDGDDDTSAISEYVASKFIKALGFEVQDVNYMKDYESMYAVINTFKGDLITFRDLAESYYDEDLPSHNTFESIEAVINNCSLLKSIDKHELLSKFWDMIILDAILGNQDRHLGNFGLLRCDNEYRFAPIYDNGNSLKRHISEHKSEYLSERRNYIISNLLDGVHCYLGSDSRKHINYENLFTEKMFKRFPTLHERFEYFKSLDIGKIADSIEIAVLHPLIPNWLKGFYCSYVTLRYAYLIKQIPKNKVRGYTR